jgi:hypothetical protein
MEWVTVSALVVSWGTAYLTGYMMGQLSKAEPLVKWLLRRS